MDVAALLARLGLAGKLSGAYAGDWLATSGAPLTSFNPANGEVLATIPTAIQQDYEQVIAAAQESFLQWRSVPAPARGELVRRIGLKLREQKEDLGLLVTLEAGKVTSEGQGEVQEMIDMCDFAVGQSRQLYGLTIASERPRHRLFEQWHPLGPIGVITAFNFPVAVWAWNAMLAAVCGDTTIWKPSEQTPLCALAVQKLAADVCREMNLPPVFQLCLTADKSGGEWLAADARVPLVSATGSCRMGRAVGQQVAARLGRSLLELGGNNAVIVTESADLELALRAVVFAAVGTAGQRCTTLRRLIVHDSIAEEFVGRLVKAYQTLKIGEPWEDGVLIGPLINQGAVEQMLSAVERAKQEGGRVVTGGKRVERPGHFVEPTIMRAHSGMTLVREETFAPLLYVLTYNTLDEAIALHNDVPQGLSSAIFTERMREAEVFLSPLGSDCGIANVNIGTSGAEIGGAFGGEKETGGGRESGSDAWKAYMRRQTCTINYGDSLPLAQGVKFEMG
jgi:aldehyde dehydrogenase (NAD+)